MRRKIPSLESLIAFEAASRHQSFTRAAEELVVTQGAISRQVAILEDYLGVMLFNRIKKRLSLTEVGSLYAARLHENLNKIERDTLTIMSHHGKGGSLELAVIPTFATRWLIPRLPVFHKQFPEIVLNVMTRTDPFLFTDTSFDAAIHCGAPTWPGAISSWLFGEELIAVVAPSLMENHLHQGFEPKAIEQFNLLHQSARPDDWRDWFIAAGFDSCNSLKGPRYETFSMVVEAARAGLGIALVPSFFVISEIAEGKLLRLSDISLHSQRGYYLVYPEAKQNSPVVKVFETWLLNAANAYRELELPQLCRQI